jgi:toxin ParE1/3/4
VQLQWTEAAEQDLEQINAYYTEQAGSRIAAGNVLAIISNANTLLEMPNRSRPGRVPNTRELVLQDLPFLLPYRVAGDSIQILRVFHTARQQPGCW